MTKPDEETPPGGSIAALCGHVEALVRRVLALEKRPAPSLRVGPAYRLAESDKSFIAAREIEIDGQRFRVPVIEE
ncbi:hypothetical protein GGR25_001104 [Kaistia hirudinis]|uniref:Uncharacterized protein n=1 Tax=Kaistia hirudinis TaxID=1293440 RepID=A0A840ANF9_9HYPH|nr:hypothetical protein [Kaistia hirudinis]MBB3930065.1 hypothetical protein [Kaistia hirudinis]